MALPEPSVSQATGSRALSAASSGGKGSLKAIAFRCMESPLGEALMNSGGMAVSLAGRLRLNEWMGRVSCEFQIDDVALGD